MAVTETSGNGFALYNGVKLPNIDSVWDKTARPYAYIGKYDDGTVVMICTSKPLTYGSYTASSGSVVTYPHMVVNAGEVATRSIHTLSDTWSAGSVKTYDRTEETTETIAGFNPVAFWTSHDILNSDGTVYLSATTPIPLEASFTSGFLLGLVSRGQIKGTKQPVAYLYNGVRLPKLPETEYQYAMIGPYYEQYGRYMLVLSSLPLAEGGYSHTAPDGSAGMAYLFKSGDSDWSWSNTWNESGGPFDLPLKPAVWANYDVMNADGTAVSVAASEPVPVYE